MGFEPRSLWLHFSSSIQENHNDWNLYRAVKAFQEFRKRSAILSQLHQSNMNHHQTSQYAHEISCVTKHPLLPNNQTNQQQPPQPTTQPSM